MPLRNERTNRFMTPFILKKSGEWIVMVQGFPRRMVGGDVR